MGNQRILHGQLMFPRSLLIQGFLAKLETFLFGKLEILIQQKKFIKFKKFRLKIDNKENRVYI